MPEKNYNWKRFWCPREAEFNLGDNGFLTDPDEQYGKFLNPNLASIEDLSAHQCLILLGEPGIGKSFEIKNFHQSLETQSKDESLFLDLKSYGDESRLYSDIFENAKFIRWADGTHCFHLFLDSLDECLLRVQTVTSLLEGEFSKYPTARLFLRVACRTAEWPYSFEQDLGQLYGKENVKAYELVPLRKKDVRSAAESEGLENPDKFLELVISKNAAPLAIKPVTLDMLIRIYKTEGTFPAKQSELYEKGCLLLCEEPSERRREIGGENRFQANVLLSTACRIAAATIFGNRYAVWIGSDFGDVPEEDVRISELTGGSESVNGESILVTKDLVKASLRTGLFTSRGPHRMGWAHQTYSEFLAARYLFMCSMSEKNIMGLLVNPSDTQGKIVPQLYETASWVANADSNILTRLLECDPEVLLRGDIASFDVENRKRLVEKLLTLFEQEKLLDRDTRKYYHKLNHPSLSDQLRPYIRDKNKGFLVRRVAVDIAEACDVKAVLPNLVAVTLDQNDDISTRVNAAYAITRIGDAESKAELRPLVFGGIGDDPEDELKGCALKACWPDTLTAEELFTVLTPPKNPNLVGSYSMFLYELLETIEQTLQIGDLGFALEWVASSISGAWEYRNDVEQLRNCIMVMGLEHLLKKPELAKPFAKATAIWLLDYHHIGVEQQDTYLIDNIRSDHQRRRLVLAAALELEDLSENKVSYLVLSQTPLATADDIPWLVQKYLESGDEPRKKIVKLFRWLVNWTDSKYLDDILEARKRIPELQKELSWLDPVEIDSPEGRKQKAQYLKHLRLEKRLAKHRDQPLLKPPPIERVSALLDTFERGEPDAWWRLNLEMTLKPTSRFYGDELESDLTKLPVWEGADENMRERLVRAAKEYLLHPPEMDLSWLGTNTLNRPRMAGYRALVLLMKIVPEFIAKLPADLWKIWAPIVVSYPLNSGQEKEPHSSIMSSCFKSAPDETIDALIKVVRKENNQHGHVFIIRKVEHIFDQRLGDSLLNEVRSPNMKSDAIGDLLDLLIEKDFKLAIDYAVSEISIPPPQDQGTRGRELTIAESLFGNRPDIAWPVLWSAVQSDTAFGKELFEQSVRRCRHDRLGLFAQQLSEQQLGDMYLWLSEQYPHQKDTHHKGAHWVGPREDIAEFRDGLLRHLEVRGTEESLKQVWRIAKALPYLSWIKWVILNAEKNTRAKTWNPLSPQQIISLAQDNQRTFIESGTQLLNVIFESLQRLEKKLHDELSAIEDLWDTRVYYPKDETYLSNYIARHLREDLSRERGIIVNREVQVQRGRETDIHIDAINPRAKGGVDIIKAIIEVKGCWRTKLETAMENQLVGEYLQNNQCPYGLYLVGWFACDKWADNDYRKKHSPKYTFDEAKSHFAEQAKEVAEKSDIPGLVLRSYVLDARLQG
jgi:hypothetical protein